MTCVPADREVTDEELNNLLDAQDTAVFVDNVSFINYNDKITVWPNVLEIISSKLKKKNYKLLSLFTFMVN